MKILCWGRGYVVIIHPGGATPVTQTPDTDLNQHVRRIYCALEAKELIACFKSGQSVAQLQPEEMVDIMVDVLYRPELHLQAADGYIKTAVAVDIDGFEDHKIVREAGDYWHKLGMREIVNKEVAMIRSEVRAGRLRWTMEDVYGLMPEYPKNKHVDAIINYWKSCMMTIGPRIWKTFGKKKQKSAMTLIQKTRPTTQRNCPRNAAMTNCAVARANKRTLFPAVAGRWSWAVGMRSSRRVKQRWSSTSAKT